MRGPILPHLAMIGSKLRAVTQIVCAFQRATKAIAAIEFAVVLPIMLIVALGSIEAARLMTFSRRINLVAGTSIQMLTQTAPMTTGSTTGLVNYKDLHFAQDSAMVIFPQVLLDSAQKGESWATDVKISMASVQIAPTVTGCTTGCTYVTNVIWNSGPNPRPCGANKLTSVPDNSTPSPTTLPQDLFTNGTVLVVDIDYTYTPLFGSKVFGNIRMQRSAYVAPRYVQIVKYDPTVTGDDGIGTECPGF